MEFSICVKDHQRMLAFPHGVSKAVYALVDTLAIQAVAKVVDLAFGQAGEFTRSAAEAGYSTDLYLTASILGHSLFSGV